MYAFDYLTCADPVVPCSPQPLNVHAGSADAALKEKIGKEGARTVPGRPEHGGNCDIKNLSRVKTHNFSYFPPLLHPHTTILFFEGDLKLTKRICINKPRKKGSKVYLPVHVAGAKFSVGDLHFSQGDGEISFCGAIEMAGIITINFKVIKNGLAELGLKSPIYIPGPVEPQFGPGRHIYFEGFSVDQNGKQRTLPTLLAIFFYISLSHLVFSFSCLDNKAPPGFMFMGRD